MPGPEDPLSLTAGSPLPSPSAPQSNMIYALPREKEACVVMWDIENCPLPARGPFSNGHHLVQRMRNVFLQFGVIKDIRAYTDMTSLSKELRGQLQASGVHLIDVPQRRKDAADKMILADLILFAVDNHPPATVVLISGDRDYAYALAKLAQRRYRMVLVVPPQGVNDELRLQANVVLEWRKGDTVLPEAEVQSGTRYAVPIPTYYPIEREEELVEALSAAAASSSASIAADATACSIGDVGNAEAKRMPSSTTPHPQNHRFSMPAPLGTPIRTHSEKEQTYFANPPILAPTAEREPPSSATFARLKKTPSATPVDTNLPHDLPNPPTPTFQRSNSPSITRLNSPSVSRSNSPTLGPLHAERSHTLPALALGAVSANTSQLSVPSVDSARKRPSTPLLESAGGSADPQVFGDESETSEVGISSYYAPLLAVISRYLQDTSRKEMEYAAIGEELRKWSPKWMDDLNVKRLKDYVSQAEAAGVIKVRREGVQNYVSLPMSDEPPLLVRGRSNQVSASVEAQDARHLELLLKAVEALDRDSIVPSRKHIEARLRELGVRNTDWFPHVVMLAVSSHRLEAFPYGPDYAYYSTATPTPTAAAGTTAAAGSTAASTTSSPGPLTPRKSALASASNLGIHWDPDVDYDEKGFTHDEWKALGEYLVANPSTAARGRYPLARKLQAEAGEAIRSMPFGKMICLIQTAVSHARWLEFRGHSLVVAHKVMDCSHCHNRDKVPLVVEHPVGGLRWQALCSQCHRQYARDQFSPSSHVHTSKSPVTATIQPAASPQPSPPPPPLPQANSAAPAKSSSSANSAAATPSSASTNTSSSSSSSSLSSSASPSAPTVAAPAGSSTAPSTSASVSDIAAAGKK